MISENFVKLMQQCREAGLSVAYRMDEKDVDDVAVRSEVKDQRAHEIMIELFRAHLKNPG